MSATEGTTRACDHPGCTNSYDAARVAEGLDSAAGWLQHLSRNEHYCPDHHASPVLDANARLVDRYGKDWHLTLKGQTGPWAREDLRDFLTCLPGASGVWKRLGREVLAVLDTMEPQP